MIMACVLGAGYVCVGYEWYKSTSNCECIALCTSNTRQVALVVTLATYSNACKEVPAAQLEGGGAVESCAAFGNIQTCITLY
jgi:ABC-type taurine transport system substrate-binding protein